jgi:hypothetical protein
MGPTLSPETSALELQTPGKFPEEYKLLSEHGESLKTTASSFFNQNLSEILFLDLSACFIFSDKLAKRRFFSALV